MGKFDLFRKLNTINGATNKEKIMNDKIREFNQYIINAPNNFEVNIDKNINKNLIVMQDVTLNNNRYGDEKYVVTSNSTIMSVGSMFECLNNTWLVVEKETNTLQDHQTFKVRPINKFLKFKYEDRIYSIPTIVKNQTLYTVGLKDGKYFDTGDTKLSLVMGVNEGNKDDIKLVFRNMRFIIDSNGKKVAYKITYIDSISNKGIFNCVLQESNDIKPTDDLVNEIASNIYPK